MRSTFFKLLVATIFFFATSANAALIKINGQQVQSLDLTGAYSEFADFYDYRDDSAHTGLEIAETIIMFVANIDEQYAIFTIVNKENSGTVGGRLVVSINASSGSILLVDEPYDILNETTLKFVYAAHKTDGYVFGVNQDFDFTQTITAPNGVTAAVNVAGVQFVSFGDGSIDSAEYSDLMPAFGDFNITATDIPEPAAFGLLGLLIAVSMSVRNRRKLNR